jgi:methyl-accepting chemotaxis protein
LAKNFDLSYILTCLALLFFTGCQTTPDLNDPFIEETQFEGVDLEEFAQNYKELKAIISDTMEGVSLDILTKSQNRDVQKNVIAMRQYITRKLRVMDDSDPRLATLNAWAYLRRFNQYVTKGDGRFLFGEAQPKLVKAIEEIEKDFQDLVLKYVSNEKYKEISKKIDHYVKDTPIQDIFKEHSVETSSSFSDFMDIPLTPFTALGAVGKGGQGIADIAITMERFTDIIEALPEDLRWQLQVLTLQMQDNKILKENTATIKQLSESFITLNTIIDKYPKILEQERKAFTNDINPMLTKTSKISSDFLITSQNISQFGKDLNQSTDKINTTIKQVDDSAKALNQAATAVSKTIKDIQEITEFFNNQSPKKDPNAAPSKEPSFLAQVELSAKALKQAAAEINNSLEHVKNIANSQPLATQIEAVDRISEKTIALTGLEAQTLIDRAFTKILILMSIGFFMIIVIIFTKKKVIKKHV